jgi:fatty-acyl-CoA synthase
MTGGWHYADVWDVAAELRPGADALVHGDRRVQWAEFQSRAAAVARSLVAGGAQRGDRVAQFLYNGPEYLEVSYATYQAGLTPVNTNYRYRADELAYLWSDADAIAVVFHGSFAPSIEPLRSRVGSVRRWLWVDDGSGPCPPWAEPYEDVTSGPPGPYVPRWGRSSDDIVMIYTGGTTGMPKGVMWRHDDLYRAFNSVGDPDEADLDAVRRRLSAGAAPVGLPASPLMHATGYMFATSMLTQGGTVVTLPNRHFDAAAILDAVGREGVEAMAIVGDTFARPILEALERDPGRWDLSSLTLLVSAGVMWSAETKQLLTRHLPSTLLVDLLGSTEAHGLGSSVTAPGAGEGSTASFRLGPHAMVIDDHGRVLGPGETGMLAVGGPGPIGYHNDPEKTAHTFRIIEGRRVSVPGDWASVAEDGSIVLLGRGSLCINTGGEKVFPEEVEEALETHPLVRDSTVVGIPDDRLGEAVAAVVELVPGASCTPDDLIAHVKARIAGYKAPRKVLIVDDVGRAPNGKADYTGARRRLMAALTA